MDVAINAQKARRAEHQEKLPTVSAPSPEFLSAAADFVARMRRYRVRPLHGGRAKRVTSWKILIHSGDGMGDSWDIVSMTRLADFRAGQSRMVSGG